MERRRFLTLAFGIFAAPLTAEAQQKARIYRVGYLSLAPGPFSRSEAFRKGLHELGYNEGQNITIEYRFAAGDVERLRKAALELVRINVDVIVTGGPTTTRIAREATSKIPIVITNDGDPVGMGFVASLARPGGNVTGVTNESRELHGKRLELLKETVPRLARVAILWNPTEVGSQLSLRDIQSAAATLGIQVQSVEVRAPNDLKAGLEAAKRGRADAIMVLPDRLTTFNRPQIVKLADEYRIPAIYWDKRFVQAGGLLAYGPNDGDLQRRAAVYVDKILKGAKPADLPVEQPTTFELAINLKTARALGLTIPRSVLIRAGEVIQ